MDKNFIGERISELRLKKNVSEYQMSLDLGKNKSYILPIKLAVRKAVNIIEGKAVKVRVSMPMP